MLVLLKNLFYDFNAARQLAILSMCILLSACAIRNADVSQSQTEADISQQALKQLQTWSVSGKLAIISPKERKSANLSWQQDKENITLVLSNVLGGTIAKLEYDGVLARLEADGQTWQDSSPSALIFQVTGWEVPVKDLAQWMKASVAPEFVNTYFDNGLVKQATTACKQCLPWVIDYTRYGKFELSDTPYTLPTGMRLEQGPTQTKLILRIDNWKTKDV